MKGLIPLLFTRVEGAAEGLEAEFADETGPEGGRGLTGNQAARVHAAKGIARQFLGSGAIVFDEQRGKILSLGLVPETVDEILGWKLIRGACLVTEEIADRMVVLAVRQPPQIQPGSRVPGAGGLLLF